MGGGPGSGRVPAHSASRRAATRRTTAPSRVARRRGSMLRGEGRPLRRDSGSPVGQRDRQRIARLVGDAKLVVQVRTGRPAGHADVADHAHPGRRAFPVSSPARSATGARRASRTRPDARRGPHSRNRSARPRGEPCRWRWPAPGCRSAPDSRRRCGAPGLQDRMEPGIGKARRDAGELHRRAQERLAQRAAVVGEIRFHAGGIAPQVGPRDACRDG